MRNITQSEGNIHENIVNNSTYMHMYMYAYREREREQGFINKVRERELTLL